MPGGGGDRLANANWRLSVTSTRYTWAGGRWGPDEVATHGDVMVGEGPGDEVLRRGSVVARK
ncbi:MAG TPA: hypothetical protein VGH53_16775 [Streptosporangiaceae bacterium]|jgi:hypothetical protein